ncbi:hypothetical protein Tco_0180895, partial [Tanacetum coccineum]
PARIPQRHVAGDSFPQRHVAGERPDMSPGKRAIVVVHEPSFTLEVVDDGLGLLAMRTLEKVRALGANGVVKGSTIGVVWFEVSGGMVSAKVVLMVVLGLSCECLGEFSLEDRYKGDREEMFTVRMTKVIKGEFEKIKDAKVEDVPLTCDTPLKVFNNEVSRLSGMDDDLFTYEVEVANIPYDVAEVFRIDTNIFDYETPFCSAFKEFNYLLEVDPDLLTKDIIGFKTYEDYKNDWIYEWNKDVPWVDEKPWTNTGVWTKPTPVKHTCKPFNYKTGCSEWPTCSWKDDGYCNGGNLPGTYIIENQLHYQDYKCAYEINHEHNKSEELCEVHELPVCNIRRYIMIKYSFNDDEYYYVGVVLLVKDCRMINHYYSEDQYAVSIKEDTAYPCLHSPKTTKDKAQYVVSKETQYAVFKIWNEYNILEDIKRGPYSKKSPIRRDQDNSTSNVLIPLDSWTSGLLVYELPLSVTNQTVPFSQAENPLFPLELGTRTDIDDKEKGPLKDDKGKGLLKDDKGSLTGFKIVEDLEKMIHNVEINLNNAKEKTLKEISNSSFDLSRVLITRGWNSRSPRLILCGNMVAKKQQVMP